MNIGFFSSPINIALIVLVIVAYFLIRAKLKRK